MLLQEDFRHGEANDPCATKTCLDCNHVILFQRPHMTVFWKTYNILVSWIIWDNPNVRFKLVTTYRTETTSNIELRCTAFTGIHLETPSLWKHETPSLPYIRIFLLSAFNRLKNFQQESSMCAAFARLKTKLCREEVLLFSEFKMVFISILTLSEWNYCIPPLRCFTWYNK